MSGAASAKDNALRFISGFELAHGRSPSTTEVAEAIFGGAEGFADNIVQSLVIEGRLRRLLHSRRRKLQVLAPLPIPRAPDGEPLFFVPAPEARP